MHIIMNYLKNITVIKIMKNSLPYILKQHQPLPQGRWNNCGRDDIKSFYANTDHCGDKICGCPAILKQIYPQQYKK